MTSHDRGGPMKRALLICALLVSGLMVAPPANAAPGGVSEAAEMCQEGYASYGFGSVGDCVSFVARGGELVAPGPAQLTLIFEKTSTCSNGWTPTYGCAWSVEGSGLEPGSEVTVGEATVQYGATVPVDSSGDVLARGIYVLGSCVHSGYEAPDFIARGIAADGSMIESAVVTADYLLFMPLC